MAIRTVRLDDEAEAVLRQIREATGLPISEALKRGLRTLRQHVEQESGRTPYDIYQGLGSTVDASTRSEAFVSVWRRLFPF